MTHPDHALWKQGWRAQHIPFHLEHVHPLLARLWSALALADTDRVFVPLCGKSLDMNWLHERGHPVIGVELSPVAVRDFFGATHLQPRQKYHGALTQWTQDDLMIYCGDFFALSREDLVGVRGAYDRAALTALPESLQIAYVVHLHAILPADCPVLLITVEDLDDSEQAEEHMACSEEILSLYRGYFSVELMYAEFHPYLVGTAGAPDEPRCIHKAYRLLRSDHE